MKKVIYALTACIFLFLCHGCYYKVLNNESIVISPNNIQTVIFVENEDGYSDSMRYIVKTVTDDNMYVSEGKYYNNEYVYMRITQDRNFDILSCISNIIYMRNEAGLQTINYREKKNWYDDIVISDLPTAFRINGFNEVIKIKNESTFTGKFAGSIQTSTTLSQTLDTEGDNTHLIRGKYYAYVHERAICYYELVQAKVVDYRGSTIDEYLVTPELDVTLLENIDAIKLILYVDEVKKNLYIVTDSNQIINYNLIEGTQNQINFTKKILAVKKFEDKIVVVTDEQIQIFNSNLDLINNIWTSKPVLGITWYNDGDTSSIKYALQNGKGIQIFDVLA